MLTGLTALLIAQGLWAEAAVTAGVLLLYFALFRQTRCRVETRAHRPCLWRVRGLFGTCEYHLGYKRSLPKLVRGQGFIGLPTFMWPRDDFSTTPDRPERAATVNAHPASAGLAPRRIERPANDRMMLLLTVFSAGVAVVALIRDFLAG